MKPKRETNQQVAEYLFNWRILDNAEDAAQTSVSGYPRHRLKWYALVEAYSGKSLSVKTDKLPAMSGILMEIATRRENDEYLAGLWKKDIFRGLSWFPDATKHTKPLSTSKSLMAAVDPGIPSWSWAAYDGAVKYHGETWLNGAWGEVVEDGEESWIKQPPKIKLLEAHVKKSDLDPFGRVFGGEIVLSGWAIELYISEEQYSPDDVNVINFGRKCYSLKKHPELPCTMAVCFDNDPEELIETTLVFLQLGTGRGFRSGRSGTDNGLVLREKQQNLYRRVGMFEVQSKDEAWMSSRSEKTLRMA